jgi:hypothetical protein
MRVALNKIERFQPGQSTFQFQNKMVEDLIVTNTLQIKV